MYSSEDLERFYFQYQTEALPHGESLQSFCVRNKVPYNNFQRKMVTKADKGRVIFPMDAGDDIPKQLIVFCQHLDGIGGAIEAFRMAA